MDVSSPCDGCLSLGTVQKNDPAACRPLDRDLYVKSWSRKFSVYLDLVPYLVPAPCLYRILYSHLACGCQTRTYHDLGVG